jgi:hypothetical protein
LSAPYIATLLILEVARPKAARFSDATIGGLLSATVAFAVFFPIAGSSFIGIYTLPSFTYKDWMLLAAIPLGLVGGVLALVTAIAIAVMTNLTACSRNERSFARRSADSFSGWLAWPCR